MCKRYDSLNRCGFSPELNIDLVAEGLIWSGSSFQNLKAATEKCILSSVDDQSSPTFLVFATSISFLPFFICRNGTINDLTVSMVVNLVSFHVKFVVQVTVKLCVKYF